MAEKKAAAREAKPEQTEDGHEGEAQPEETAPKFEFPDEFFGNEWDTFGVNMLYWAKYVDGQFTYEGTLHENSYAVVSDAGEKQIVAAGEFSDKYTPVFTQPGHEPSYILLEEAAATAAKAK
jgi:hypothetical protein